MKFYKGNKWLEKLRNGRAKTPTRSKVVSLNETSIGRNKIWIISIVSIIVAVLILLFCTGFALFNINSSKILSGIAVNNIEIKGLTKEEAENKILGTMQEVLDQEIVLKSGDFKYSIKLDQIETEYDVKKAVEEAYNIGRNGNIFSNNFEILKTMTKGKNVYLEYSYNKKLLDDIVLDIAGKIPDAVVQPSYYIEGNKLIVVKGKEGKSINTENAKNEIIKIINGERTNYEINLEIETSQPKAIDIEQIHKEVYKEPKDAYYTKDPFEVFPHENGIDFDVEKAKEILKEDKEEYEIELKITEPKVTTSKIGTEAFPDLLSSFTTKYDVSNTPRTTNLILAMQKLDGVVVPAGEVFSYNQTLGKRTAEAGYKEAGGFAGGRVVQTLAGGICQISSTLYDAAVYANLDIVERHNHMFLAGYVGAGKDATVVYGNLDLKFKNTRKYPIMIKTSIGGGVAKVSIFGVKEDVEYEVEISTKVLSYTPFSVVYENDSSMAEGEQRVVQNGMNGCKSVTYKILKLNGKEVSSKVLSNDVYDPMNKIIKRGTKKSAQKNTEKPVVPKPQPTPTPTQPTTPEQPTQEVVQPETPVVETPPTEVVDSPTEEVNTGETEP